MHTQCCKKAQRNGNYPSSYCHPAPLSSSCCLSGWWDGLLHLEVTPDVSHGALHKDLPCLLLQRLPPDVECVHISQVVDAADVHPVPRGDLWTMGGSDSVGGLPAAATIRMLLLQLHPRPPYLKCAGSFTQWSCSNSSHSASLGANKSTQPPATHSTANKQLSSLTHRRPLCLAACFLHVLLDLLQPLPLAVLGSHPEAALEASQPRDGHVHAHGVQETHLGALGHNTAAQQRGFGYAGGAAGPLLKGNFASHTPLLRAKSIPSAGCQLLRGTCYIPSCHQQPYRVQEYLPLRGSSLNLLCRTK